MERIGKYVIHKAAITSGQARVFFCQDPDLQVPVAVKLFTSRPDTAGPLSPAQWLARFQTEARALAAFDHPHVIGIKTMESQNGQPFFVMPYQATNLAHEMGKDDEARRMSLTRSVTLLRQLSAGLMALHRRGMVHRQVRPSNVLLTARENGQVKLADFSKVKLPERNPPLPDHWFGPTEYCAPEQREAATTVGPQADVYSLGVLAYRMVTGTLPDPSKGSAVLPETCPAALIKLVAEATDPDPARRHAHAGVFLQGLGTVPVEPATRPKVQVVSIRRPAAPAQAAAEPAKREMAEAE